MSKKEYDGIVTDLSNEEYHGNRTHVSSSVLKEAIKSPKKFYEKYVLNIEDPIPLGLQSAFDFGTYIHAAILEPHLLDTDFAIYTGATRRGGVWESFKFENKDKIILTESQIKLADKMLMEFAKSHVELEGEQKFGPELYEGGIAEQSFFTELDGVKVKVRSDYRVKENGIWVIRDVKTTSSDVSTKEEALEVCLGLGYNLSAALYCDAMEKVTGEPHRFEFTFLTKKGNNKTYFYKASKEFIESGRKQYKQALRNIKKWRKTGVYYTNEMEEL